MAGRDRVNWSRRHVPAMEGILQLDIELASLITIVVVTDNISVSFLSEMGMVDSLALSVERFLKTHSLTGHCETREDLDALYQIYHDVSDVGDEILADGREIVFQKLSVLFAEALAAASAWK